MSGFYKGAESWDVTPEERQVLCARINESLGRIATLPAISEQYLKRVRREKGVLQYVVAVATGGINREAVKALSDNRLPRVHIFGEEVGKLDGYVMAGQELTERHMRARIEGGTLHFDRTAEAEALPRAEWLPEGGLLSELRIVEFALPLKPEKAEFYNHVPKTHPIRLGISAYDMGRQLTAIETAFAAYDATQEENS